VQKLAPIAEKTSGKISAKMSIATTLDEHMDPVYTSMNGNGGLLTSILKIENVNTMNKIADALKMDKLRKISLEKLNLSFDIIDGKINIKPFDLKTGNIKANVSGWTALDQTIGYVMNMEIPRKEFGGQANGVLNSLVKQANAKGANFSVGEMIPVAVLIGGTLTDPKVSTGIKGAMTSAISNLKEQAKEEIQKKKEEVVTKVKEEANKLIDEADAKAAKILADAQKQANNVVKAAESGAANLRSEAAKRADQLVAEGKKNGPIAKIAAQKAADKVKKEADTKANKLVDEARKQSQSLLDKARQEADKIKQDARAKANASR
jgi:vacuolar-type H+-ATPase subunit H